MKGVHDFYLSEHFNFHSKQLRRLYWVEGKPKTVTTPA